MNEARPMNKQDIILKASGSKGLVVHAEHDYDAHLRGRLHVFRTMGILYVEKAAGNQLRFKLKKDTHLL